MNKPIHVLQVAKSTGGVAEYVGWLVHGLDHAKFKLTVVCLSERSQEFAQELGKVKGVDVYSLDMNRFKIDPLSDLKVLFQLRKIIRNGDFDLIHAHASKPGYLARLAAIGTGVPLIYSPHCFSFHAGVGKLQANLLATLERFAARYLTTKFMVVANGEQTLAQMYRVGRPEQFVTIYNGIDFNASPQAHNRTALKKELRLPDNVPLVGAVGRLNQQKGPFDFVRMAARIHSEIPEARFVWIGAGPLEHEVRQLSKDFNLDGILYFMGQRSNVPELLSGMDCFVLPSLWEGFSIVLLEAMAVKAPIVATDILGNNEAIRSGVDGWLVEPGNIEDMSRKVISLINSPDLAKSFGDSSFTRVKEEFNRVKMLENVEKLYTDQF